MTDTARQRLDQLRLTVAWSRRNRRPMPVELEPRRPKAPLPERFAEIRRRVILNDAHWFAAHADRLFRGRLYIPGEFWPRRFRQRTLTIVAFTPFGLARVPAPTREDAMRVTSVFQRVFEEVEWPDDDVPAGDPS